MHSPKPESALNSKTGSDSTSTDGCEVIGFKRRDFLRAAGTTSLALLTSRLRVMAGPFEAVDFEKLVPADKKLSAAWVRSLFERGTPAVYGGADLNFVGMPVGGICAGQLYLGGDGKLWHWDIFNKHKVTYGHSYAKPYEPSSPMKQGFSLKIGERTVALDKTGFSQIGFRGEYPVGTVNYKDPSVPVEVTLEAFSPFIPLNTDDSSLPATIMRFTVRNTSATQVDATLTGMIENAVGLNHRTDVVGIRRIQMIAGDGFTFLECSAEQSVDPSDILFEDWSSETYQGWTTQGTAFGKGPILKTDMKPIQAGVGGDTDRVVNSYATAPHNDGATGKLTSRPFTIKHKLIAFWIGGGKNPGKTCLNLVVDGKVVRSATGKNSNHMEHERFEVSQFKGKEATLEIVDAVAGPWGNVGVGRIVFCNRINLAKLEELADCGSMGLALLGAPAEASSGNASSAFEESLIGELGRGLKLEPGASATVSFVLTWFFPNYGGKDKGRYYATRFDSARAVAAYVAGNFERLVSQTLLWRDTWYDSTLPYWFLDRTFLNASTLATSTSLRYKDGRFWGWEGVGCCAGTCGHVWYYAQSMGRLFPELERILRERTDFGIALQPDGAILFRGENGKDSAIDAQAGVILRSLREHQMAADDAFLKRIWPGVRKATEWLIAQDANADGILEGPQHNTLDSNWYGPIAWLSGVYLAALHAAAALADEMNETAFAAHCRKIAQSGRAKMVADLFDGEYFINKPAPEHSKSINTGTGCEIDQVIGQSWAFQVGLPRVLPEQQTRSALKALWRYNFSPDVGPYRAANKLGRWFAMAGEAGLLICTFPRKDWDFAHAAGEGNKPDFAGYFNECMNGFEHQVAGHMIWEGMVMEGLAIERAIHDRYSASKRNPWNEVECGDHYARSMASYGVFVAACGYEYHGPKGHLGFAPRLTPENFKAPFTAAEGWGTFSQELEAGKGQAQVHLRYGKLSLRSFALATSGKPGAVHIRVNGSPVEATHAFDAGRLLITFAAEVRLSAGDKLEIF